MSAKKQEEEDDAPQQEMEADSAGDEARFGAELKARDTKVNQLVTQQRLKDALAAALENPPLGTKSDQVKDQSADICVAVLNATKEADIKGILDSLNDDQCDILCKYIYRYVYKSEQRR